MLKKKIGHWERYVSCKEYTTRFFSPIKQNSVRQSAIDPSERFILGYYNPYIL